VTVPQTIARENLKIASAGPGAVWVVNGYGFVRITAEGTLVDFTPQLVPGPNDNIVIGSSSSTTAFVVDEWKGVVLTYDGAKWNPLPNPQIPYAASVVMGTSASDVWIGGYAGITHWNGTRWSSESLGVSPGTLVSLSPDKAVAIGDPGYVCPGWCHPDSPPYGTTVTNPWTAWLLDDTGASVQETPYMIPAPADLGADVKYTGVAVGRAADGKLALVGCAVGPAPDGGPQQVGTYVVHEWDGQTLTARAPQAWPACGPVTSVEDFRRLPPPLLDGTLPLAGKDYSGIAFIQP
jgi:hypothetical protein